MKDPTVNSAGSYCKKSMGDDKSENKWNSDEYGVCKP